MNLAQSRWRHGCDVTASLRVARVCCFLGALLAASESAGVLVDVTQSAGIQHFHNSTGSRMEATMSGGAAAGDFDRDGWVDLYVTRIDGTDTLYRNNGDGTFSDVTAAAFPSLLELDDRTNGPVWGDIDNDGDLDLYVTSWGGNQNYLFLNNSGVFEDVSLARQAAIAPGTRRTATSATFGDYDGDGYIDLYSGEWNDQPAGPLGNQSRLLRNLGAAAPGHYEDVTQAAGVQIDDSGFTFSPRFSDLDRDGRIDLALASDFGTSSLHSNNGDGTFTDGTDASGANRDGSAMGSTIGDYDNDGDLDWFLGNIKGDLNNLYLNQLTQGSPRQFGDLAVESGVGESDWSWGSSFFDYDNDGDLDLIVTNGVPVAGFSDDPMYLFRNDGPDPVNNITQFSDVSDTMLQPRDTRIGSGLLVFDYDRDGDEDVFVVNGGKDEASVLYRNDGGNANSYLQIELTGQQSNRDGLGAWIEITPNVSQPDVRRVWEFNAGSNFLGQNELMAHFGWGNRQIALDLVEITWPSGRVQRLYDVAVNQRLTVVEPVPEPATFTLLVIAAAAALQLRQGSYVSPSRGRTS